MVRWCCAYGDTVEYAAYVWDALSHGADTISPAQFQGEPFASGVSLSDFKALNRQRYEDFQGNLVGK